MPPCYRKGKPIPLILNFHGWGETGETAEIENGQMDRKADQACFIAVYPNALNVWGQQGLHQHWNIGIPGEFRNPNVDDVGFVSDLLDELEAKYSVDARHIYATGMSSGAMMSYRLACDLASRIAAVAPVAAGMSPTRCNPARPVPILHFHGMADPEWPYYGGIGCWRPLKFPPISETIDRWIAMDQCKGPQKTIYTKGDAICRTYDSCLQNSEVILCTTESGGHTWPGGFLFPIQKTYVWSHGCFLGQGMGDGKVSRDISALDVMWKFFERHPMPQDPKTTPSINHKS